MSRAAEIINEAATLARERGIDRTPLNNLRLIEEVARRRLDLLDYADGVRQIADGYEKAERLGLVYPREYPGPLSCEYPQRNIGMMELG